MPPDPDQTRCGKRDTDERPVNLLWWLAASIAGAVMWFWIFRLVLWLARSV